MPVPSCSTVIAFSLASPPTVRGRPPVGSDLPELDGTDCGAPCPNCNVPADGERPLLPAGFMTDIDADDQDR